MCGIVGGVITSIIGIALVVASTVVTFLTVPDLIENLIINEVVLFDDTIQLERFEEVPIALNFTLRVFNVTNPGEVVAGGVPVLSEVGPYVYKIYQRRAIEGMEEDTLTYRQKLNLEFDPDYSYPNTEEDIVTIVNLPYHAILQTAERRFPELMNLLSSVLSGVFGQYNSPIIDVRIRDLVFDGIRICQSQGIIVGIACNQIRTIGANSNNLAIQDDGSIVFSLLTYREQPSMPYKVHRGINDVEDLGRIITFDDRTNFDYWSNNVDEDNNKTELSVCNMINGTDAGIFQPFVTSDTTLYAVNTDICRSVELRYQYDTDYEGIPVKRFAVNEWFLDNDDGCFCLNMTPGINREDGCLLKGTMELFNCVGAPLVLSYPHFLFADPIYVNGVIGMNSSMEDHRIFLDLEPNTGTVLRGAKRAQFNLFLRPILSVTATNNLNTTLTPIVWFEESVLLPEEFVDEIKNRMLFPLNLVSILLPVVIALCCVVFVLGVVIIARTKLRNRGKTTNATT